MPELYTLHDLTLTTPGEALFAALATAVAGLSRSQARQAVMAGLVQIDGAVVREAKHPLAARARVRLDLRQGLHKALQAAKHGGAASGAQPRPFVVVHEDSQLLVVDKAAGVLSAPTNRPEDGERPERGHVPELVRQHWRKKGRSAGYIGLVHRLDRETSGCLCFALTREAQRILGAQFAGHSAQRTYRCLVAVAPLQDQGTINTKLGRDSDGYRSSVDEAEPGKESITHWRVVRRFLRGAEMEVRLETGRTHQIRIHLAEMGCSVLGDRVYGRRLPEDAPRAPRMMLHAWQLSLDHPRGGTRQTYTAPLPPEFEEVARLLNKPIKPAKPALLAVPVPSPAPDREEPARPRRGKGRKGDHRRR